MLQTCSVEKIRQLNSEKIWKTWPGKSRESRNAVQHSPGLLDPAKPSIFSAKKIIQDNCASRKSLWGYIGSLTFCPVSWSMQVKERIADNQAQPSRNLLNHQRSWFPHVILGLRISPGKDVSVVLQKTCRVALEKRVAALQHWPFFTPNVFR